MNDDDADFPRSYKELHGAPYDPDPGVAAYLAVMFLFAAAAIAILVASYL